jgi:hypothetical protein
MALACWKLSIADLSAMVGNNLCHNLSSTAIGRMVAGPSVAGANCR